MYGIWLLLDKEEIILVYLNDKCYLINSWIKLCKIIYIIFIFNKNVWSFVKLILK